MRENATNIHALVLYNINVKLDKLWVLTTFADKDRELGDAHAEIKSLKNSERLKEKAVEEVLLC